MDRWVKKVHFIGIGGIGMSGIAEVLLNLGFEVTGSDLKKSPVTERLESLGGKVAVGHAAENVRGVDVVVISSAVTPDNPEVVKARYEGIPVIPRAEMLSELMRMKRGIAVARSHGKTTTTSMVSQMLSKAGLDPTAIIGGKLNIYGSNAKMGQSEWLVAEADESDGSFLHLTPTIVIVTNIDREHMDHYGTEEKLHDTFVEFMNRVPFYGVVIAGIDDSTVRSLIPRVKRRVVTYGLSGDADIRALDVKCPGLGCSFLVVLEGQKLGKVTLDMPGEHNAVNALAAMAVAFELDVDFETASKALHGFTGVGRRFEVRGEEGGVMVIDDYAHHPTEIKAALKAARDYLEASGRGEAAKITAAFQPHRYSRTRDLWKDFTECFFDADHLVMTEIYPAGEAPIEGVTSLGLFKDVDKARKKQGLTTEFCSEVSDVAGTAAAKTNPGDLFVTLGAGSIWQSGEEFLRMKKK